MGCERSELSVTLTDDGALRALNRTWRGKDKPTDVLSFSQVEGEGGPASRARPMLGDVIVSLDTAQRQAVSYGHDLTWELARLLVHGVLHLLGYDHVHGGRQAAKMQREETRLLRAIRHALDAP